MEETDLTRFTEAELMAKHQRGIDAIEAGQGIRITMEQLETMADEKNFKRLLSNFPYTS